MADLKIFASSHKMHSQVCFTPRWSLPHPALEFQSTVLTDYKNFAQTLMQHWRWDMEFGSRFLRCAQYMEASLLQHFYNRMLQCYRNLHTSIAPPPPCVQRTLSDEHSRSDRVNLRPNELGTGLQNRGFRLKDWGNEGLL